MDPATVESFVRTMIWFGVVVAASGILTAIGIVYLYRRKKKKQPQ